MPVPASLFLRSRSDILFQGSCPSLAAGCRLRPRGRVASVRRQEKFLMPRSRASRSMLLHRRPRLGLGLARRSTSSAQVITDLDFLVGGRGSPVRGAQHSKRLVGTGTSSSTEPPPITSPISPRHWVAVRRWLSASGGPPPAARSGLRASSRSAQLPCSARPLFILCRADDLLPARDLGVLSGKRAQAGCLRLGFLGELAELRDLLLELPSPAATSPLRKSGAALFKLQGGSQSRPSARR